MNKLSGILFLTFILTVPLFSQAPAPKKAPEIRVLDGKVSVQAEGVPLGQLMRLLDAATGMTSTVSNDTANRSFYVRFSDLDFNTAIRKLFEGQPLDYIVIPGKGIQVKGVSEQVSGSTSSAATTFPQSTISQEVPFNNGAPPVPPIPQAPLPAAGAPAPVPAQTPVGVVPNARPAPAPAAPPAPPGAVPVFGVPTGAPAPAGGGAGAGGAAPPPLGNGAVPVFTPGR